MIKRTLLSLSILMSVGVKTAASQGEVTPSYSGPPARETVAKQSLNALLTACPSLRGALLHAPKVELTWVEPAGQDLQQAFGWHHLLTVEADLPDDVMQAAPAFFQDPQWGNHLMIRLGGGRQPGAVLDWPTDLWLCDMEDQLGPDFMAGRTRNWTQRNVLKPISALQVLEPSKMSHGGR